jgi:periplasmic copper chaperone A
MDGARGAREKNLTFSRNVRVQPCIRPVKGGLEIKPGETVELKPGSFHVMFVGLKKPLERGEHIKATLVFEKAGKVNVEYDVRAMGAMGGEPGNMPGMKMGQ